MSNDFWARFHQFTKEPDALNRIHQELDSLVEYLPKREQERYIREIQQLKGQHFVIFNHPEENLTLLKKKDANRTFQNANRDSTKISRSELEDSSRISKFEKEDSSRIFGKSEMEFHLSQIEGPFRMEKCSNCKVFDLSCDQLRLHGCSNVEFHNCHFKNEGIIEGCDKLFFVNCKNAEKIRDFDFPFEGESPNIEIRAV